MSASQEDIALKAEARRRKILENAQKRLDKVLIKSDVSSRCDLNGDSSRRSNQEGVTKCSSPGLIADNHCGPDPNLAQSTKEIVHNSGEKSVKNNHVSDKHISSSRKEPEPVHILSTRKEPESTESFSKSKLLETLSKGPGPLLPMMDTDEFDFTKHLNLLSNKEPFPPQDKKKKTNLVVLSLLQYAVLGVVVRLLLYFQFGWLFGEMILVPFLLTESIQISLGIVHTSQFTQVLVQVMTLCGFSSHVVQCYARVNTVLLHCIDDFSIYYVCFCIVHNFLDEDLEPR